jgi:hypothetical protein
VLYCAKRLVHRCVSALQDHAGLRSDVVGNNVCAAAVIIHAAEGVCVWGRVEDEGSNVFGSCLVQFLSNPDTDSSIRSLMGGAKGSGGRVTFAPFVTDKEQFLSVAQVR